VLSFDVGSNKRHIPAVRPEKGGDRTGEANARGARTSNLFLMLSYLNRMAVKACRSIIGESAAVTDISTHVQALGVDDYALS
jgi:hypothetical protein